MCGYFERGYDSGRRFISYWHQINEIMGLNPESVLEVGIGNGFVSNYLRERGLNITTLDIRKELSPDIVASVLDMPLNDNSFDIVACYEVLEHMGYDRFITALSEINRVCRRNAIISLPEQKRAFRLLVDIPALGGIKWMISMPRLKDKKLDPIYHSWEIGCRGYPLKRIVADMKRTGFFLSNTYRVFENPFHRYFVLEKVPSERTG